MQTATRVDLLDQIIADFEDEFNFKRSSVFSWSPAKQTIYYSRAKSAAENAVWSLLHEIGHAKLGHKTYHDDLELLIMEVEAWRRAKQIAESYHLVIDEDHIEECLESYRIWLHDRSRCIECGLNSFQIEPTVYECSNCYTRWSVPASRMCKIRKQRL